MLSHQIITGVIGHPVKHSRSPELHNHWYQEEKLPWEYKKFDITPADLANFLQTLPSNLRGLSVTVPHKESIRAFLDSESSAVTAIGACNTVIRDLKTGHLHGENTDWQGWLTAFKAKVRLAAPAIIVYGAGGSARAILYALKEGGYQNVKIFNRTYAKAAELATKFGFSAIQEPEAAPVAINCTSLGLAPIDPSPIPPELITKDSIIYDLIYTPSKLAQICRNQGAKYINGEPMLIEQAKLQHQLFTASLFPNSIKSALIPNH